MQAPLDDRTSGTTAVLIVDDDPFMREAIALTLEVAGYEVRTAANGAEALDLLEKAPTALLITDLQMPTMDGRALTAAARARQPDLSMLVISGAEDAAEAAAASGAQALLAKPFGRSELLTVVTRLLSER